MALTPPAAEEEEYVLILAWHWRGSNITIAARFGFPMDHTLSIAAMSMEITNTSGWLILL